jgi:hypothetical protein
MREKVPLATLMGLAKKAAPPRDFKGALVKRIADTGAHAAGGAPGSGVTRRRRGARFGGRDG